MRLGSLVVEYANGDALKVIQELEPRFRWNDRLDAVTTTLTIGNIIVSKFTLYNGWQRVYKKQVDWEYRGFNILEDNFVATPVQPYVPYYTVDHETRSVTMRNHAREMQQTLERQQAEHLSAHHRAMLQEHERRAQQREAELLRQREEANRPRRPWERFRRMFE